MAMLIEHIETEAAVRHAREGTEPVGSKAVLAHKPADRPRSLKKMLAPPFHAATKAARNELVEAYKWFTVAYREAADRLRHGDLSACFPDGCFPPSRPFVRNRPEPAPG